MHTPRPDDPQAVMEHAGRYTGGTALVVLGGDSGSDWESLRDRIHPDVILGANGVSSKIPDLDYWMLAENMSHSQYMARRGDPRSRNFMKMLDRLSAKTNLISHRSWNLVQDHTNCIRIRRAGWELLGDGFSLREYGAGFFYGPLFSRLDAIRPKVKFHVGTVACHLLHMAGILGCSEVHTIGMDFCFRGDNHHWYQHPAYQPDRFRTTKMFTTFGDLNTQWDWIEGAKFLKSVEYIFERDGLVWHDHSDGLLQAMGLKCTK